MQDDELNLLDQATRDRLSKLRSLPVDTSRLQQALRKQIPATRRSEHLWRRLGMAAAACLLVVITLVGVMSLLDGGQVMASPDRMAAIHQELVEGRAGVVQVSTIDEANVYLANQWKKAPGLPDMPESHVMACCMRSMDHKKLACVLLNHEGTPVSVVVARADDVRHDTARPLVHTSGKINMVMLQRQDRWVCIMGEVPADQLNELASALHFD